MWFKFNRWIAWKLYPKTARLRASKLRQYKPFKTNRNALINKVYQLDEKKYEKYGIKKKDIAKVI